MSVLTRWSRNLRGRPATVNVDGEAFLWEEAEGSS